MATNLRIFFIALALLCTGCMQWAQKGYTRKSTRVISKKEIGIAATLSVGAGGEVNIRPSQRHERELAIETWQRYYSGKYEWWSLIDKSVDALGGAAFLVIPVTLAVDLLNLVWSPWVAMATPEKEPSLIRTSPSQDTARSRLHGRWPVTVTLPGEKPVTKQLSGREVSVMVGHRLARRLLCEDKPVIVAIAGLGSTEARMPPPLACVRV